MQIGKKMSSKLSNMVKIEFGIHFEHIGYVVKTQILHVCVTYFLQQERKNVLRRLLDMCFPEFHRSQMQ